MRFFIGWVAALAIGVPVALHVRDTEHIGAPALHYSCPAGSYERTWWVKDSSPVGRGAPGTLEWHGYREIAACAASTTVSAG